MKTKLSPLLLAVVGATVAAPSPAWARHGHAPPAGRMQVVNASGGVLRIEVDGAPAASIGAGQTLDLWSVPGTHTVRASYDQYGIDRTLEIERVYVPPGRSTRVVLEPEDTTRLRVVNDSPFEARLHVDGRPELALHPGEARLVELRVGWHTLSLVANGRAFASADRRVEAFRESTWTASLPRTGTLSVYNPLPIPVELVGVGTHAVIPPEGHARYAGLPLGSLSLRAVRTSGEPVDTAHVDIRWGGEATWRVDPPRTGLVQVSSAHFTGVRVLVDGASALRLGAEADGRLTASVGWHAVRVVDAYGRTLFDRWLEVDPFTPERIAIGHSHHERAEGRGRAARASVPEEGGHPHDDAVADAGSACPHR